MNVKDRIKGGLIVSCQALENEPMHGSYIMSRFAAAAVEGGAIGIRANTAEDICEIRRTVSVPVIGIVKRDYKDSDIYITPTMREIDEIMSVGAEIIALDATKRARPNGLKLDEFISEIRAKYKDVMLMADISDYEEAVRAETLGFDFVGTTLRGYTEYTKAAVLPDTGFIETLAKKLKVPVIAEGGIGTPEQLRRAIDVGAFCAVVGGAITRPQNITKGFVAALKR